MELVRNGHINLPINIKPLKNTVATKSETIVSAFISLSFTNAKGKKLNNGSNVSINLSILLLTLNPSITDVMPTRTKKSNVH